MKKILSFILITLLSSTVPAFAQDSLSIEVAFSPKRGATESITKAIEGAKHNIRVAAYSFTSKDIAAALIKAFKKGVDIKVVLDKSNNTGKYSAAVFLANAGIPTRINYKYAIMHNKFMVIDGVTVETGSFNYTAAAEDKNAENVLILKNYPDIAGKYLRRWQELWEESEDYKARY